MITLERKQDDRRVESLPLCRNRGLSRIWWAPAPGAGFGDGSKLLEPGEWGWSVSEDGVELDSGTVVIRAEEMVELVVDLGD